MISSKVFIHWRGWLAGLILMGLSAMAQAAAQSYTVTAPDGVAIAVQEAGDPNGQPIVFIHGLLGSHLSWEKQVNSPELQRYRLITYDMRGHGISGQPERADAYSDGRRWADDLAAVIAGSGARQPVVVGWSLGAAVVTNYLAIYGDQKIGGAVYVGGVIELAPGLIVSHPRVYRGMASPDLKTHLDAEREFVRLCFAKQPDAVTYQRLLANAAMASENMQNAVQKMSLDAPRGLGAMKKRLLLVYGAGDALVQAQPSFKRAKELNPGVIGKFYPESGHSPFLEEAGRFNRDLAAFVDAATARR
ncbi:pimeloyl-ACP methyl ester carboxylesterase [Advenella incenata]|jgi:pimeloyl-ACP methyl ester carboxylesterase|uniref:Pimeloyl-ACP methyl ester carboxylesterase n=1 Tax=Advenella incenata TaxID=267800 RepID=A0A4Q7VEZ9_9BURK|nr:pimeloyl-ACP methyl ester carboxylesterase [Advenella incenata]